jgi:hypothetical protein
MDAIKNADELWLEILENRGHFGYLQTMGDLQDESVKVWTEFNWLMMKSNDKPLRTQ